MRKDFSPLVPLFRRLCLEVQISQKPYILRCQSATVHVCILKMKVCDHFYAQKSLYGTMKYL